VGKDLKGVGGQEGSLKGAKPLLGREGMGRKQRLKEGRGYKDESEEGNTEEL
jgi:hypothetical protein